MKRTPKKPIRGERSPGRSRPGFTQALLVLAVCLVPAWSQSEKYENLLVNTIPVGVRAAGLGGAFIAVADDYSTAYYNPAGITQIKRFEISVSLLHHRHNQKSTVANRATDFSLKSTRLGNLGIILPYPTYRGSLVFSLGYNRWYLFDGENGFKVYQANSLQASKKRYISGGLHALTMAAGIDLSPRISAGFALNILNGIDNETETGIYYDTTGTKNYFNDTKDLDYLGINVKLGLLLKINRYLKLGLNVETPTRLSEEGYWIKQDDVDPDFNSPNKNIAEVDNSLTLPFKLSSGMAVYLPYGLIAIDLEYIDWEQLQYNEAPDENHREILNLHVGLETIVPKIGIKLRTGYNYKPVVFKYLNQVDTNRHTFTFGTGFLVDKVLTIDLAGLISGWTQLNSQYSSPLNEEYSIITVLLSTSYRF